jgi:hypothetical protein
VRAPVQNAGGNAGVDDCSGTFDTLLSHAWLAAKGFAAGDDAVAQYWSRDPFSPQAIGLTNALSFEVTP